MVIELIAVTALLIHELPLQEHLQEEICGQTMLFTRMSCITLSVLEMKATS